MERRPRKRTGSFSCTYVCCYQELTEACTFPSNIVCGSCYILADEFILSRYLELKPLPGGFPPRAHTFLTWTLQEPRISSAPWWKWSERRSLLIFGWKFPRKVANSPSAVPHYKQSLTLDRWFIDMTASAEEHSELRIIFGNKWWKEKSFCCLRWLWSATFVPVVLAVSPLRNTFHTHIHFCFTVKVSLGGQAETCRKKVLFVLSHPLYCPFHVKNLQQSFD